MVQPATNSMLGVYKSRPPLAKYVWYIAWYLSSSCGSEPQCAHIYLSPLYHLSTLDIIQRYQTGNKKLCGPGNEVYSRIHTYMWSMHPNTARETAEIVTMSTWSSHYTLLIFSKHQEGELYRRSHQHSFLGEKQVNCVSCIISYSCVIIVKTVCMCPFLPNKSCTSL